MTIRTTRSKKLVAWLVLSVIIFALGMPAQVAHANSASDISGHWASKQIQEWIDKGYVRGYEDGSFKPNNPITRAEFAVLVNKSFGFTETIPVFFNDVSEADWFYGAIATARAAGYIGGYEDGSMKPNSPITRQEAAAIVAKLKDLDKNSGAANIFTDAKLIPEWSKGHIGAASAAGYMKGYEDGSFQPLKNITRAEAVVVLDKVIRDEDEVVVDKVIIKDIDNQKIKVDKTSDVTIKVEPKDAKIEIKNDDDKIVKSTLKDNVITLKGLKVGTTTITVTATKEGLKTAETSFKVTVEKTSSGGGGGGSSSSGGSGGSGGGDKTPTYSDIVNANESKLIVVLDGYVGVAKIQLKKLDNTTATITVNGEKLGYNSVEKAYIGGIGGVKLGTSYDVVVKTDGKEYKGTIKATDDDTANPIDVNNSEIIPVLNQYVGVAKIKLVDATNITATIMVNGDKLTYNTAEKAYVGGVGGVVAGQAYDVTVNGTTYAKVLIAK